MAVITSGAFSQSVVREALRQENLGRNPESGVS